MLNSLTLKNYRAFREQRFNFSKLNIFVGPNNSGKSSAISAINLLAQTVSNVSTDSPLILNGEFDDLGTFIDVIHGNRSNTPLGMEFSLDDYKYSIEFKYQKQRREINVSNFKLYRKNKNIYSYNLKKTGLKFA